jgi:hypothetical protein
LHFGKIMLSSITVRPPAQTIASKRFAASSIEQVLLPLTAMLGVLSFGSLLCSGRITEGDLWAKLALGAHVWKFGSLPQHDSFAFTPVLPDYVDHEWGAGTIFFGLLKFLGPNSLMGLKVVLAFGAITAALMTARRAGCDWKSLLILAIPCASCVVLGYVPVIRSHAFTYFFFALTLLCLEEIVAAPGETGIGEMSENRAPSQHSNKLLVLVPWPALTLVAVMLLWVNVHGGFAAGLGTIALYTSLVVFLKFFSRFFVAVSPESAAGIWIFQGMRRSHETLLQLLVVTLGCLLVTCINPYGPKFWLYVLPALLAKRPLIAEWQSLAMFANDAFTPFRILFAIVLLSILVGWKDTQRKSWSGLMMLVVTALLAWRSRRHAPFFGIAALCFAGPFVASTLRRIVGPWCHTPSAEEFKTDPTNLGFPSPQPSPSHFSPEWILSFTLFVLYSFLAFYASTHWLPNASFQVLAPVGHDPVREADILSLARVKGNLATPFHWGSYCAWRLYPNIKISMDGRYEAAFPESTFQLNARFFDKAGSDWDRLIRDYPVDYVLLDLSQSALRPDDLRAYGYVLIWETEGSSALLCLEKHAQHLRQTAIALPQTTINPLDPRIPDTWPALDSRL